MIVPNEQAKQECNQVTPAIVDKVFQLRWYCSTGVFFSAPKYGSGGAVRSASLR